MYINGKQHRIKTELSQRLIDFLRVNLHLTGTKEGCGEGECGACSVVLNDEAVNSCLIPVGQLDASDKILTIEGVVKTPLGKKLVKSFLKNGAIHCGFCTPGMIVAAYAMLKGQRSKHALSKVEGVKGKPPHPAGGALLKELTPLYNPFIPARRAGLSGWGGKGGYTADEIKDAIAGNLCRCTGYKKIVEAIKTASR